jgi:hypothetical protein
LAQAAQTAQSDAPVPEYWERFTEEVFQMDAKTYTPALGAALLAKATDDGIDPLAIKATGERGYSLRTVGHSILVPASQAMGFSIRTTGREPLNNQPFFRYDHMTRIGRVRNREQLDWFVKKLQAADSLAADTAQLALAAFLRVAFRQARARASVEIEQAYLTISEALSAVTAYLAPDVAERPKKLQAFVAAAYDMTHVDVRFRKINDPSRDYPGDVQAYSDDVPFLAVEVRGKPVPATELDAFITACAEAGITRVGLLVDSPGHQPIDRSRLQSQFLSAGSVHLSLYESVTDLIEAALEWTDEPQDHAVSRFATRALARLEEVEVSDSALVGWQRLISAD